MSSFLIPKVHDLEKSFVKIDADHDGVIQFSELLQAIAPTNRKGMHSVFRMLGKSVNSGNGQVGWIGIGRSLVRTPHSTFFRFSTTRMILKSNIHSFWPRLFICALKCSAIKCEKYSEGSTSTATGRFPEMSSGETLRLGGDFY